jgi:cobalt-zinc-cadmium efflux system protein
VGGIIIRLTGYYAIDPILTLGFTVFVLWGVSRNLREALNVLLEGVPSHIDLGEVKKSLMTIDGVLGVHDVHVWSLDGETDIFTGHIIVEDKLLVNPDQARSTIKEVLRNHHIEHSTTEIESEFFCSGIECGLKKQRKMRD